MSLNKQRLDIALVDAGEVSSRSRAQDLIKRGKVSLNGTVVTKTNLQITPEQWGDLVVDDYPWVSRSALKLVHALSSFDVVISGKVGLDLGASTGGFTQVLLANGATHVYAVDVGRDQLHETLRVDDRVDDLFGINARDLTSNTFTRPIDLIVSDVSFISLKLALPAALDLATPGTDLLALIKPQFEVGKGNLGKGGIVRDEEDQARVCMEIEHWLVKERNWVVNSLIPSPLLGPDGNQEFIVWAKKP